MSHDDATIGDYLLGELDATERAAFERRMAEDPALRTRVERLAPTVVQLDELPDAAWDVVAAPTELAAPRERAPRRRRRLALALAGPRAWGLATAASIVLLAIGVAIGVGVSGGDDGSPAADGPTVVLAPLGSSPAPARAEARMTGPDRMELTVGDLPPSPAGTYYEAWLLNDADDLVPVASFRVDTSGTAVVAVPLPASADRYRYLDISLQRLDAGTEHSSQSVLRGALS